MLQWLGVADERRLNISVCARELVADDLDAMLLRLCGQMCNIISDGVVSLVAWRYPDGIYAKIVELVGQLSCKIFGLSEAVVGISQRESIDDVDRT